MIKTIAAVLFGVIANASVIVLLFWLEGRELESFFGVGEDPFSIETAAGEEAEEVIPAVDEANPAAEPSSGAGSDEGDTASTEDPGPSEVSPSEATLEESREEIEQSQARFGRIFASMKVDDAVGIIEHLPDDLVRGVLAQLPARTSAAILGRLPADRAARLTSPFLPPLEPPVAQP